MIGGIIAVYFFALIGGTVVSGSDALGPRELIALVAVGLACAAVVYGLSGVTGDFGHQGDIGHDRSVHAELGGTSESRRARPPRIDRAISYLIANGVQFERRQHGQAITAQELAHILHVSGHRVAKTVIVSADGQPWMVVLPASERIDLEALRSELGSESVRIMSEAETASLFPGCEVGAEPPLGRLFAMPSILERDLWTEESFVCHGGTHTDSLEVDVVGYTRLEQPRIAHFATVAGAAL